MRRLYSASDVRRYSRCPRQWWYETHRDDLVTLSPVQIRKRMNRLRRRYGVHAAEQPAYRLLVDLATRSQGMARGLAAHRAHGRRVQRRGAQRVMGVIVAITIVILSAIFLTHLLQFFHW